MTIMRKIFYICLLALTFVACGNGKKKVYRPSEFPKSQEFSSYSFAIPYSQLNNSINVRIRLNGGPQFDGIWDSGCSVPLKISSLEAAALVKSGTLSGSDYQSDLILTVANGQKLKCEVYMLKSISFVDNDGVEHSLSNIQHLGGSMLYPQKLPLLQQFR